MSMYGLQIIGNLIYYRYINHAIVAPDACDILIDPSSGAKDKEPLNNEQRKNLGSIAKILQFAASKKGFGEESAHLTSLNPYIVDSHERFKEFFADCVRVAEPEDEFRMDAYYSEAVLIAKPVIYITLAEIVDTHDLLLQHRFQIAQQEDDPLHELLDDLGGQPSMCSLIGAASDLSDSSLAHLGQTEVGLTLSNKFELSGKSFCVGGGLLDVDRLMSRTKRMIAQVLPCTKEGNLLGCLKSRTSEEDAQFYWTLMDRKDEMEKKAEKNRTALDRTHRFDAEEDADEAKLNLEDSKRQILKNLQLLERHGRVSKKDGFQAIIQALARDIASQKAYRSRRRAEIFRIKKTLVSLDEKRGFYEEQLECYNQYLKQCLANLQLNKENRRPVGTGGGGGRKLLPGYPGKGKKKDKKLKSRQSVQYSGSKLHDKGVLLTIEGLPEHQFKNVQFEFVPVEDEDGAFEVHARFMGVRLEHVDLDVQELLQLQYEGVAVMNLFGKARINVNLLLHLLNVKFYGRK